MSESAVATRYAEAFCGLAHERDVLAEAVGALESLREPLEPAVERIFANPQVSAERRHEVLDRLLPDAGEEDTVGSLVRRFCKLLIDKDRFRHFASIVRACRDQADRLTGRKRARVEVPYRLDETGRERLRGRLGGMFDAEIVLDETVDPQLEAGLRVQVDDILIDHDVRSQLDRMRERFHFPSH